jgi:DNA-binding HxlR family transcriptional regulator
MPLRRAIDDPNTHRFEHDSIARALQILHDRWTFLILRECFFGMRRFGEFARNLPIAKTVLAARLTELVGAGVLDRVRYRTDPDWYEYHLTNMGRDLYPAIIALMAWSDHWLDDGGGPPLVLHHRTCDHDTIPRVTCSTCGEALAAHDIDPRPGPGAGR